MLDPRWELHCRAMIPGIKYLTPVLVAQLFQLSQIWSKYQSRLGASESPEKSTSSGSAKDPNPLNSRSKDTELFIRWRAFSIYFDQIGK